MWSFKKVPRSRLSDCDLKMQVNRKGPVLAIYVKNNQSSGCLTAAHSVSVHTAGYLPDLNLSLNVTQ